MSPYDGLLAVFCVVSESCLGFRIGLGSRVTGYVLLGNELLRGLGAGNRSSLVSVWKDEREFLRLASGDEV